MDEDTIVEIPGAGQENSGTDDQSDLEFRKKMTIIGGFDKSKQVKVKCGGCTRVLGGAVDFGIKESLLAAKDAAKTFVTKENVEQIVDRLAEKYEIKKDYVDALKQVATALGEKSVAGSHEYDLRRQVANGLSMFDELNIDIPHSVPYPDVKHLDVSHLGPQKMYASDIEIEKLLYDHMIRVEEYFIEVTKVLYEILFAITAANRR